MKKTKARAQFSPNVRDAAVRMVEEQRDGHRSRWATIVAVASKIGSTPQTVDNWTKQAEGNRSANGTRVPAKAGKRPVSASKEVPSRLDAGDRVDRLRALEREIEELRRENALLRRYSVGNLGDADEIEPNRRDKILLVASRNFLDKGYSATSVDEIAEAAGTTGPALYRLFESKQDILDNICLIGSEKKLNGVQDAISKDYSDPSDTLRDLIKNRIEFALSPWGCQVPIADAEVQHLSPFARTKIETEGEINRAEWFRCIARVRPETPTRVILAIINAVIMEITYVGHHINEIDIQEDISPTLQRLAWTGVMS